MILVIAVASVTATKHIFSNDDAWKILAVLMLKRVGYGALNDKRTARTICVGTGAYENVPMMFPALEAIPPLSICAAASIVTNCAQL